MTHKSINNLNNIEKTIKLKHSNKKIPNIIAISKTYDSNDIIPLVKYGHLHFGENKVQEAISKWIEIKKEFKNVQLHMVGKLQSNKVKYAVPLFDYLHSLDNIKLANKISIEQKKIKRDIKIFIQVNIGNEEQKNGIQINELSGFYDICVNKLNLNIIGLMCLPPEKLDVRPFFKKMRELNKDLGLKELSMGMSSDYLEAIDYGASYVRIGSKIFGKRF